MFRRLLCVGLLMALIIPAALVPAGAAPIRITADDLRVSTTETVNLKDAIQNSFYKDYITFYYDEACTDKVSDTSLQLSQTTRFYARADYDGRLSNVAPFYVYTGFDFGSIALTATRSGNQVRLTATVTRVSGKPAPTGEITFYEGSHAIGTISLSGTRATYNWDYPGTGVYLFSATYGGDDHYRSMTANCRLSEDGTASTSAPAPATSDAEDTGADDDTVQVYEATHVRAAAADAVALARTNGTSVAQLTFEGPATVTREAVQELIKIAERENLTLRANFDERRGNAVTSRVSADFKAGMTYTLSSFRFAADTSAAATADAKRVFDRFFANRVTIAKLEEQAGFGMAMNIAIRMDVDATRDDLHFYRYDLGTNRYVALAGYVDAAGYVRVTTDQGGYIVVSEGALTAK